MPLSKARMRERKQRDRYLSPYWNIKPNSLDVKPNRFYPFNNIADQVRALYPDGMLPNCKDGRYRVGKPTSMKPGIP